LQERGIKMVRQTKKMIMQNVKNCWYVYGKELESKEWTIGSEFSLRSASLDLAWLADRKRRQAGTACHECHMFSE